MPYVVMAVLAVALLGLWFATDDPGETATAPRVAPLAVIADRVEALRDLRFDGVPRAESVSPDDARRQGLQDLERSYPEERRRADEEILKLLGLIEPDTDLRELTASLFGEGVAGFYDPRTDRLSTVEGAATGTTVLAEMTLAHELTHALEDQRFGLDTDELSGNDDAALAYLGLIEGTATSLMYSYVDEHFTAEEALGGVLGSAFADTGDLPPYMQATVLFPYVGGERFVAELLRRGGGSWAVVDTAFRFRPPASTEQVLHPDRYFDADEPARVRIAAGPVLGEGWVRAAAGTWGELQTRELLARGGGGGAGKAAQGWGGDRYELWRSRPLDDEGCAAPCRAADVLIMRWRWDTPRDERQFMDKLEVFAGGELDRQTATIARSGGEVTLVIGPQEVIAKVARRA
jgi:hypothetical protein